MLEKLRLGDIITFRYSSPSKKMVPFEPPRNVLVLTSNFQGFLHGIKIDGLTPVEQESIQRLLQVSYSDPKNFLQPFKAQMEMRKKELEVLNKQRADLLRNGQRVIMTPSTNPLMGMANKAKNVLGSIIGRISTFGRTQVNAVPAKQMNPMIEQKLMQNEQMIKNKTAELDSFFAYIQQQEQVVNNMQKIPNTPYEFYHMFFKSFIGNSRRMKSIYRKYDVRLIKTPRIIRSIGIIPNAG